jgi:precorrin-6B methylase 2
MQFPSPLRRAVPACAFLLFLPSASAQGVFAQEKARNTNSLAPYVTSPQQIVDKMLEAVELKPGETLYDLGSGDGRVLITAVQKFSAKAVGVELDEKLVKSTSEKIEKLGLSNRAKVIHGNMLEVDISPADVVVIYLTTESNDIVRPALERQLRPGTRVISHDFQVRGWKPVKVESAQVHNRSHQIYIYQIAKKK